MENNILQWETQKYVESKARLFYVKNVKKNCFLIKNLSLREQNFENT